MKKIKGIQILIVLLFFILLYTEAAKSDLLASSFQEEIARCLDNGELPIVMLTQETGEYAYVGRPAVWAAEYAVGQVNRAGGINGERVRLVTANTNSDKGRALSLFQGAQRETFLVIGPADAPETAYIAAYAQDNRVIHLASYSYAQARQEVAPYGISYMSDSEDGELEAVKAWAKRNPDIKDVVIFTSLEDESKKNSTVLFQSTLGDIGLSVRDIVDVKPDAEKAEYQKYAMQALNQKADGYIFLLSGKEYANILVELRRHGIDEGRRISASFSSYISETIKIAGDALDGTYIWNKFDPFYSGSEWQALLTAYGAEQQRGDLIANSIADYYDAVKAVCRCYETFGVTSKTYKSFQENKKMAEWFYNSDRQDGIQGSFAWHNGKKVMDYQFFIFQGEKPINQKNLPVIYQN